MTVSSYFNNHKSPAQESELLDSLVIETIQQRGFDLLYSPRELHNEDSIFGEDGTASFENAVTLEMIGEDQSGFSGEGEYAAMMGLDIRDEYKFTFSRTRFEEEVQSVFPLSTRPFEGDIIIFNISTNDSPIVFEITFVEHDKPFFQLGMNHTYDVTVKRLEYSYEEMNTGVDDIDALETELQKQDNEELQIEGDSILDFSETDPFGENP